jgi:hypothetical protein
MRCGTWIFGLLVLASACSSGGHSSGDGGANDAVFDLGLDLPGCPPPVGNEKGVGTACTNGGNQCGAGLRCTCDPALGGLLTGVPCFCTLAQFAQNGSKAPCTDSVPANFCGTNARCCEYLQTAAYCVPNICLPGGMCLQFTASP